MMNVIREVDAEDEESAGEDEDDLASFRQEWRRELQYQDPGESRQEEPEDLEDDLHQRVSGGVDCVTLLLHPIFQLSGLSSISTVGSCHNNIAPSYSNCQCNCQ